jgi:hypothetical protein
MARARLSAVMIERWLIAERDPHDLLLWRYGPGDSSSAALPAHAPRYRYDPSSMVGVQIDDAGDLYPTVALLLRMAGARRRITWDLTYRPLPEPPRPPTPPATRHVRSTAGKAKGAGETLGQRANRARGQPPRAAA